MTDLKLPINSFLTLTARANVLVRLTTPGGSPEYRKAEVHAAVKAFEDELWALWREQTAPAAAPVAVSPPPAPEVPAEPVAPVPPAVPSPEPSA